ncbi:hypothetical protein FNE58_19980 [Bacillus thuringiensis]|uniref:Uncharacterized protein n=2 Tax=Bacillus thuringiensis TaxID=1428 RepID=A0A9X6KN59_BACTU|nr:hypothetical protein CAB88_33030 [Bacillus thuringiensis]OTZ06447.1 hypothetical protein BK757_31155 [Bacillus thuringiensis serovar aizawai]OTZ24709.1 hypothetical protein BK760_30930 [Bacillus thuringiensis serovar tolworthi]OTZ89688.1 hypothetical protein BK770_30230 [Bacillus thuringiensis serovar colmeri]OTZ98515.1 hypothetical protein BK789_06465 [Bacillus thuringiensis serovar darmstadiensis]PER85911.1 hypothetical protein CN508_29775 [Bacillus cereus]
MNIDRHKPTYLLSFTYTDCSSKTEVMRLVSEKRCNCKIFNVLSPHACRSCENQTKVGSVVRQCTRYLCSHCRDYG